MKLLSFPFQIIGDLINSIANPQTRRNTLILAGSILGSCLICFGTFNFIGGSDNTATSTPVMSNEEIINNAVQGISDSFAQTAAALPTFTPTSTPAPSQTSAPLPTNTSSPTSTSTSLPTATIIVIIPTQPQQAACSCSDDLYNCKRDFSTHAQAQACFNYCQSQSVGDIHQLDGNNDNVACETLP